MCAGCAIGFYLRDKSDFDEWKSEMKLLSRQADSVFSVYEQSISIEDDKCAVAISDEEGFELI